MLRQPSAIELLRFKRGLQNKSKLRISQLSLTLETTEIAGNKLELQTQPTTRSEMSSRKDASSGFPSFSTHAFLGPIGPRSPSPLYRTFFTLRR